MEIFIKYKDTKYITFIIDDSDLSLFIGVCYRAAKRNNIFYLFNRETNQYFHRLILNAPKHLWVDHINGNTLDNRRCNLRLVTPTQNAFNRQKHIVKTSKYKGVSFCKLTQKYRAYISFNGKRLDLGRHVTAELAAQAYNQKALELSIDFYKLNKV